MKNKIRIAKRIADLGYCSRREAEKIIEDKQVKVNGVLIDTPVFFVDYQDKIAIKDKIISEQEISSKLYAYYKPNGLVCSNADEKGRSTIFDDLSEKYPDIGRLIYVGRLDLNSEGLLLLTNNGEIAKQLSLPSIGLVKVYKARVFGRVSQNDLDDLAHGITIDGMEYRSIVANILKSSSKNNMWIEFKITEGKNREIRNICEYLGLQVNRLIRTSFGPYSLDGMMESDLAEVDLMKVSKYLSSMKDLKIPKADKNYYPLLIERKELEDLRKEDKYGGRFSSTSRGSNFRYKTGFDVQSDFDNRSKRPNFSKDTIKSRNNFRKKY